MKDLEKRAGELGIDAEDNTWDNRELGADEEHAKVSPQQLKLYQDLPKEQQEAVADAILRTAKRDKNWKVGLTCIDTETGTIKPFISIDELIEFVRLNRGQPIDPKIAAMRVTNPEEIRKVLKELGYEGDMK